MIRYFRQRNPFHYFQLFALNFLLNISLFFNQIQVSTGNESIINELYNGFIEDISHFLYIMISLIANYFISLLLNFIFNRFKLIDEINLFPAFLYIIIGSMFPGIILLSPAIISLCIMLIVIFNLLSLFDMENAVQHLFFTAFYLSIASLLFYPLFIYIVFVVISYPILKRPNWRELIIIILGILVPLHFIMFYHYWFNSLNEFISVFLTNYSGFRLPAQWKPVPELIPFAFMFIVLFIGFIKDSIASSIRTVQKSRFMRVFSIYLLISTIIFIFFTSNYLAFGVFFLIPATYFTSLIFISEESRFNKFIFMIMLLLSAGMQLSKFGFD